MKPEITRVFFRVFPEGDVIAIFPDFEHYVDVLESYQHKGQHGACSPNLVKDLPAASEEEYTDLKKELESIGYVLEVLK